MEPGTTQANVGALMVGLISDTLGGTDSWGSLATSAPSSVWDRVDPLALTKQIGRSIGNTAAQYGAVDDYGRQVLAPEPDVAPEDLNRQFAVPDTKGLGVSPLKFDAPLPASVAQSIQQAKQDELARADASARQPAGIGGTIANFATGLLDPVGAAASFVPVMGQARLAGAIARGLGEGFLARTVARGAEGALAGGTMQVPLVGLRYGLSQQEHADYTMSDALADLAMGTVLGGGLHVAFGGASDALGQVFGRSRAAQVVEADPVTRADALRTAVAAGVEDRPVDAASVIEHADALAERDRLQDEWLRTSYETDALTHEIGAVPDPTRPDADTQGRLDAITRDLADPSLTGGRRAELLDEQRLLTEGAAPPDDLEMARSQSQREGLQAAIARNQARLDELEQQIRTSEATARAQGAPAPEDVAVSRQADAVAKAPSEAVPKDLQQQISNLEEQLGAKRAEAGGGAKEISAEPALDLAPEHVSALMEIDAAGQKSAGFVASLKQAAACLLRGIA